MMARRTLDRARVISSARDLVNRDGLQRLTMRALSAELGVEAASLYGHVKDKADILDGLAELVYGEIDIPQTNDLWPRRVELYCNGFRRALLDNPNLVPVVAVRPVMSPSTLAVVEAALTEMVAHGLTPEQAIHTFDVVVSFVVGHVLFELSSVSSMGGHKQETIHRLRAALPVERFPYVSQTLAQGPIDRNAEFNHGVTMIVDGIRPLLPSP